MQESAPKNEKGGMLKRDGVVIGTPPKSKEELDAFLHAWIEPTWRGNPDNVEEGVMWLKEVAKISYAEALATLHARNPRMYEQLAFSTWGNGYGETMKQFETDLLEALQKAAI